MILMGFNPDREEEEGRVQRIRTTELNKGSEPGLYSGLKQEPGSSRSRSGCVAASIGPQMWISPSPPPGPLPCFRVCTGRFGPVVPPEPSRLPVEIQSGEPRQQHRSPAAFSAGIRARIPAVCVRAEALGARCSEVCFPGWAAPDVRWICRYSHSTAPLSLPAGQSQRGWAPLQRCDWPAGPPLLSQQLNTEIT